MQKKINQPRIGIALSGGSGKSIAHIGVLETFREAGIPIDAIAACSSAAIVAGAYACGTMESLKQEWLRLDRKFLLNMFELDRSGKAILTLDKAAEWSRQFLLDKNFEDVRPRLGFTSVDILTGEPVLLCLGNIGKAGHASCALPGLVEPVPWGNKLLVDGGLYSLVPAAQAKELGADIVIGINISNAKYAFTKKIEAMRKIYKILRDTLPGKMYIAAHHWLDKSLTAWFNYFADNQSDVFAEAEAAEDPGVLAVLGRAIDISTRNRRKFGGTVPGCDYLVSPKLKHLGKLDTQKAEDMYEEGRRAAAEALPDIHKLIADWQWRKKHHDK